MKTNRIHYTWEATSKAPTISKKEIKKPVNWPFYLMIAITATAIITQDNLLGIIAGIYIFFYVINKIER